ncbi:MAG: hypothetical protein IJB92_05395 [Clostridia bacterium]|nr:hypothetical protein [Clostridia bacterium]
MKNKLLLLLLVMIVMTTCACSLADPDAQENKARDTLIGVYVTYEHLDLFDNEKYIQDNLDNLIAGKEMGGNTSDYQGKLYAELIQRELTDKNGNKKYMTEYSFEGFGGMEFFVPLYNDQDGDYYASTQSDGISDAKMHVKSTDEGDFIELSGTIYFEADKKDRTFYMNPVYQQADGNVYAVTGNGMSMNCDGSGVSSSTKLEEKLTQNDNGNVSGRGADIEITFTSIDRPKGAEIVIMDKEDNEIKSMEMDFGEPLETIYVPDSAEYIVVKQNESIAAYDRNEEYISLFVPLDNGICAQRDIKTVWK